MTTIVRVLQTCVLALRASLHVLALALFLALVSSTPAKAEPVSLQSLVITGDAIVFNNEVTLTHNLPNRSGRAMLSSSYCAKEFILNFDLNVGTNAATQGGSGISVFATDNAGNLLYRAHADTALTTGEDSRFEVNDNHVSLESAWAAFDLVGNPPSTGNTIFGPLAAARMPFVMKAAGWFKGTLHKKANHFSILLSDGTSGLTVTSDLPVSPTQSFNLGFEGKTDTARNTQRIRNLDLTVIDASGCPGYLAPLTREQAQLQVDAACGAVSACPEHEAYLTCVGNSLTDLLNNFRISALDSEYLMLQAQYGLTFCEGFKECLVQNDPAAVRLEGYNEGFSNGVASIDVVAIQTASRTEGYQSGYVDGQTAGVASGDAQGYSRGLSEGHIQGLSEGQTLGYTSGFSAGKSEGYALGEAAGHSAGYSEGYSAGVSVGDAAGFSRGLSQGQAAGYSEGRSSGLAEGEQLGYTTGFAAGDSSGFTRGKLEGYASGDEAGYSRGQSEGYASGFSVGKAEGDAAGYQRGLDEGYNAGYESGIEAGRDVGYSEGHEAGLSEGLSQGRTEGYVTGFDAGKDVGYASGLSDGDAAGFSRGEQAGYATGYSAGDSNGFSRGQSAGYSQGYSEGDTAGYSRGTSDGYSQGLITGDAQGFARGTSEGYTAGQVEGYNSGYSAGVTSGKETGYETGFAEGKAQGYQTGYDDGKNAAAEDQVCSVSDIVDQAKEAISDACPCDTNKNYSQFISCAKNVLKLNRRGRSFESWIEATILAELKDNQCGKKPRKNKKRFSHWWF